MAERFIQQEIYYYKTVIFRKIQHNMEELYSQLIRLIYLKKILHLIIITHLNAEMISVITHIKFNLFQLNNLIYWIITISQILDLFTFNNNSQLNIQSQVFKLILKICKAVIILDYFMNYIAMKMKNLFIQELIQYLICMIQLYLIKIY